MAESLTLKWGTLKAWNLERDETKDLFNRYAAHGMKVSAMAQHDNPEQKQLICDLIDAVDCETIGNDWSGEDMTKAEAKKYVLEYRD